ncbi:hypothetical protein KL905_000439 [Ogataea polymorpha]|nr:hypothetical protein KL908_001553 [Ogataea polymorpha]KAG7912469.1 hypothetical protein KL907_000671 [Ogataea polymorpha]KAG7924285.1 hypothetical protein KL905_000439 [Ogataea polymorpha]
MFVFLAFFGKPGGYKILVDTHHHKRSHAESKSRQWTNPRRSGLATTATGPSICPASEIGPKEDHPPRKTVLGDVLPATTPTSSSPNSTPAGAARC